MSQSLADLLSALAAIVILVGLAIAAFKIEPHWVSKDGHRFICKGQYVDDLGNVSGGWHEYRFRIDDNGEIEGKRRSALGGRHAGVWRMRVRSPDPPRRKAVYLLHPVRGTGSMLAIRLPERSRAVAVLDELTRRAADGPGTG